MDITVQELKEKLDRGDKFVFIDVREPHEFEEFNLGARLIPLGNVEQHLEELKAYQHEEIVMHCRSGGRSGMAQQMLQGAGFTQVRNLTGGVLAWQEAFGSSK
ncbi:MAG: rhodanese-like domain-containing protein [Bacteroidota bacterium]